MLSSWERLNARYLADGTLVEDVVRNSRRGHCLVRPSAIRADGAQPQWARCQTLDVSMSSDARRVRRRDPPEVATDSRSARYGRWTVKWRWLIVAAWVVGLNVLVFAPTIGTGGDQLASIIPIDSPAIRAEVRRFRNSVFRCRVAPQWCNAIPTGYPSSSRQNLSSTRSRSTPEPPLLGAIRSRTGCDSAVILARRTPRS